MSRSFNTAFNTERSKVAPFGAAPFNYIEFDFLTPITTSDQPLAGARAIVKSWSFVDSNTGQNSGGSIMDIPVNSDLQVVLINSEATPFTDSITTADPIENIDATLYQSYKGMSSAYDEVMFYGRCSGYVSYSDTEVTITIKGIWEKYDRVIGSRWLLSEEFWPAADPSDVGKMMNFVVGEVDKVRCNCIYSGVVDNLASTVTAIQTTLPLVDASKWKTSGNGKINIEPFTYTGKSGNTLTGVTRGFGAAAWPAGTSAFQKETDYVYQVAYHVVKSIGDIYVDGFLMISSITSKYDGRVAIYPNHANEAIVTIKKELTVTNVTDLLQANGMTSSDATAALATMTALTRDYMTVADVISVMKTVSVSNDMQTIGTDVNTLGIKGGTVKRSGVTSKSDICVAKVEIGDDIVVDCSGVADDIFGTVTGVAYQLLERPDHIIKYIISVFFSMPTSTWGSSYTASGTFYNTNGYKFSFVVNKLTRAGDLLASLAVQCRSKFIVDAEGNSQLIVRQLAQAGGDSVTEATIKNSSVRVTRNPENVVNTFTILWDKDNSKSGDEAYRGATNFEDATSVARYGTREPTTPDDFIFDAVKISAMVDHVGGYWLDLLEVSRAMVSLSVFHDNLQIEPADFLKVTHHLDSMTNFVIEVLSTRLVLGSAKSKIMDRLEVIGVEN